MHPDRKPTLDDVAKRAGVHPSTASRSLDATQSGQIGESTRARVLAVAQELGYRPNPSAIGLRRQRTNTIGVLIPDLTNPMFGALLGGVTERLGDDGYTAVIVETKDEDARMIRALHILSERGVDGTINACARPRDAKRLKAFTRQGIPMVLTARDLPSANLPKVSFDDFKGGTIAGDHLLGLGHRNIVQLKGPDDISAFEERSRGFAYAVSRSGLPVTTTAHTAARSAVSEGRDIMRRVLAGDTAPTAVFAHSDLLAVAAMAEIKGAGLRCPQDISVIAGNDMPLAEFYEPPLTAISFPAVQMGRIAAETVLSMLKGNEPPEAVALHPKLIVRSSTGPVPPSIVRASNQ